MKSLSEWILDKLGKIAVAGGEHHSDSTQGYRDGCVATLHSMLAELNAREGKEDLSESYVFAGPRMAPILNALCAARRDILHEKWYEQDFPNLTWLGFLLETMGEIAHTSTRESESLEDLRIKVCGIAAISVAWLEYIEDRKQGGADE